MPYAFSSFISYDKLSFAHNQFNLFVSSHFKPKFLHQIVKYPHWREVMKNEIHALKENNTFTLTNLPPAKHPIGCK
jgi:hypothetical protein